MGELNVTQEPNSPTHNAETVAEGPRWKPSLHEVQADRIQFIGRAGPIDLWMDPDDPFAAYLAMMGKETKLVRAPIGIWCRCAERIVMRAKEHSVHLTLHDECIIHQLCATHNPNKTKETTND
jgi:hypothetical protein